MNLTAHEIGLESLDGLRDVDSLCLFVAEDERPLRSASGFVDWRLCGGLSNVLRQGFFTGTRGDWLLVPAKGRLPVTRIFVGGIGPSQKLTSDVLQQALSEAGRTLAKARVVGVALEVPGAGLLDEASRAAAVTQHFLPAFLGQRVAVLAEKAFSRALTAR